MAYPSLAVADSLLDAADQAQVDVSPMQLQKLLYFLNGWHMEICDGEAIIADPFEAWQFGPVIPKVYHTFKRDGSEPIKGRALNRGRGVSANMKIRDWQKDLMSDIISVYGRLSGSQMSHLTHKEGTPWHRTWRGGTGRNNVISPDLIHEEFKSMRREPEPA